jgi:hypothetical protein
MIAASVYLLCAITSVACAVLLLRGYAAARTRLLLWSALCFVGLAVNNILLFVDKVVLGPEIDLTIFRTASATVGLAVMLYGLIWDIERKRGS